MHEIKVDIKKLGYVEYKIEKVYYRKPIMYFDEAIVSIEDDNDACELIKLCTKKPLVELYMEHPNHYNWAEMSNVFNTQQYEVDDDD